MQPARTNCPRATARPFRRDPEGPRRDLHLHTLGTWYSTIPCSHGMGKAGAVALSPCSTMAVPSDHPPGNRAGGKQDRAQGMVTVWDGIVL